MRLQFGCRRGMIAALALIALRAWAQEPAWQAAAGHSAEFEVASVRLVKQDAPYGPGTVDLDASDYSRNTGNLIITDGLLVNYLIFAYRITDVSLCQALYESLPKWTQTQRFRVEARVDGSAKKDRVRLMMQALLAERFQLTTHWEQRTMPLYGLRVDKAGVLGVGLKALTDDLACQPHPLPAAAPKPGEHPAICWLYFSKVEGLLQMRIGGWTMEQIAGDMARTAAQMGGMASRPIVDETGLTGRYDLTLDFVRESQNPDAAPSEVAGDRFEEALRRQGGLRLVKETAGVRVLVVDRVEKPSEN